MSEIQNFLNNFKNYYSNSRKCEVNSIMELDTSDIVLYKIESITFKEDAPRREALENVLSALRIEGINFIYLILGNGDSVEFYYGISKDYVNKKELEIDIDEIGKYILEPSIKGNFHGSKIDKVNEKLKRDILSRISTNKYYSMVEGVPGVLEKDDSFQGVDRLADVMSDSPRYGFMIISSLVNDNELENVRKNIFEIYSDLVKISKESKQTSIGANTGISESITTGTNDGESRTETTSNNHSIQEGKSSTFGDNFTETSGFNKGTSKGSSSGGSSSSTNQSSNEGSTQSTTQGKSKSTTQNNSETNGSSKSQAIAKTKGTNESNTKGTSTGETKSESITIDIVNKQAGDWIKYIDEILLTRLDYGCAKGIFRSGMFCFADSKAILKKLENTIMSLFSGESGNKVPLRAFLLKDNAKLNAIKNMQLAAIKYDECNEKMHSILSQSNIGIGNIISSKELSLIAGLPKKEVVGLELHEEVEFGLNFEEPKIDENKIKIGKLIHSGNLTNKIFNLDRSELDKHIFITGVTGSGKTTTCQNILIQSSLPFMVIEPAKTEYRILKKKYNDLLIFTLGKDTIAPFRLNPFEFFEGESITSRVDMIKASIEAAFDMEAAIPQIIESAIYEAYKEKGWNINTNENEKFENPFADGVYAFPTLDDLFLQVDKVVKKQGFDERLKNDYLGSIRARLNGLMVGAKGAMLNTKRSIDFRKLLDTRVVFELEEIRNGSEKSLIMGFILGNMLEAIKAKFKTRQNKHSLAHIILVEEAHRLLSKYEPGDSLNKKQGVEVFADMLAEIRKYGECLMIADQIPNKLTSEVLKNTSTKIVHRIFAEDDKRAIANTMALEDEQADFLSKLEKGRAIVFSGGFSKAVSVQIDNITDTTNNELVDENIIRDSIYEFYAQNAKNGIIIGSDMLKNPSKKDIAKLLEFQRKNIKDLMLELAEYPSKQKVDKKLQTKLKNFNEFGIDILARILIVENSLSDNCQKIAVEFLDKYLNNSFKESDIRKFKDELFLA